MASKTLNLHSTGVTTSYDGDTSNGRGGTWGATTIDDLWIKARSNSGTIKIVIDVPAAIGAYEKVNSVKLSFALNSYYSNYDPLRLYMGWEKSDGSRVTTNNNEEVGKWNKAKPHSTGAITDGNCVGNNKITFWIYGYNPLILNEDFYFKDIAIVLDYTLHTHSYTTETARTASTCYTKGSVTKKCSCGQTQTTELALDLNNHAGGEETRGAYAATCTATGYTGDVYCKGCGAKLRSGSTIAKKAHSEVTIPAVAATCTTTGLTEGKKCSVCNAILVAQQTVPVLGHSPSCYPEITSIQMLYQNKQISADNKVPAGEYFRIVVGAIAHH